MHIRIFPRKLVYLSGILMIMLSCRKEDKIKPEPPPTGPVTQQETNKWILDSMRYFYLWNTGLPAKADTTMTAINFFNTLKKTTDSFSQIIDFTNIAGTVHKDMLHSYGLDYEIISINDIPQPVGVVKFVIPGTAPDLNGLSRGNYITRINKKLITAENAAQLAKELMAANSGTVTKAEINGNTLTEKEEVFIENRLLLENPLYVNKTWIIDNKKVGYIFYNYFDDYFDDDLVKAFISFKAQNVTELIIDLRYNPGGSLTAAAVITALTAPNITENSIFIKYAGNPQIGSHAASFKGMLAVPESEKVVTFADLSGGRLSLKRVFILTTALTASAAEVVVNNLRPYMQVIPIGEKTYGKDKGSVIVSDMRDPKRIPWVMYPITYMLSNANGDGNYSNGIAPAYAINELSVQPLRPIGDSTDILIAKALSIIAEGGRIREVKGNARVSTYYNTRRQASADGIVIIPR